MIISIAKSWAFHHPSLNFGSVGSSSRVWREKEERTNSSFSKSTTTHSRSDDADFSLRRFARLSAGAAQQYPPSTTTKSRLVSPLNSKTRVLPLFLFNIGKSFLPSFLPSYFGFAHPSHGVIDCVVGKRPASESKWQPQGQLFRQNCDLSLGAQQK